MRRGSLMLMRLMVLIVFGTELLLCLRTPRLTTVRLCEFRVSSSEFRVPSSEFKSCYWKRELGTRSLYGNRLGQILRGANGRSEPARFGGTDPSRPSGRARSTSAFGFVE